MVKPRRDLFNLTVVDMPYAKGSSEYLQKNPQVRAEDIMMAFEDKTIDGIITSIGGLDSIRLLPHMDLSVMTDNPKVFMGFSDINCVHFMCRNAGISSFYGPSLLANFAADPILPYTVKQTRAALFQHHARRSIPFYGDGHQYNTTLREVIASEFGCKNLPVFINVEFGHTQPMTVLPYGACIVMNTKTAAITFKEPIVSP